MAHTRLIAIIATVAVAVFGCAYSADAYIEGPGVYYGLELPEAFYNYWNYTTDIKQMHVSVSNVFRAIHVLENENRSETKQSKLPNCSAETSACADIECSYR